MMPRPKRTEHGPRFENANPGKGCNSTHVARARRKWRRRGERASRHQWKIATTSGAADAVDDHEAILDDLDAMAMALGYA